MNPPFEAQDLTIPIIMLIPVATVIGLFTLLSVVGWARERRREREALYRHETARKLVEHGQMTYDQFEAFQTSEAERPLAARSRALELAGSVLALGGLAFWLAARTIHTDSDPGLAPLSPLGFVPLAIGVALLFNTAHGRRKREGRQG